MLRSLAYRLLPPPCVVCGLEPGAPATSICRHVEPDFFPCKPRARALRDNATRRQFGAPRVCGRCLAETPPRYDDDAGRLRFADRWNGHGVEVHRSIGPRQFLDKLLASRLSAAVPPSKDSIVIPVPLAFERTRQRGFNQSHHIARALAAAAGLRILTDRLLRVRHTAPQQTLALNERRAMFAARLP